MAAACGHRDRVVRGLTDELNLASRRVGFLDIPVQLAHVATEVQIGDRWHFFDSTFGFYFAQADTPEVPLSITRARDLYPGVLVMQANVTPYTGRWMEAEAITFEATDPAQIMGAVSETSLGLFERTYIVSELFIHHRPGRHVSDIPIPLDRLPVGSIGIVDGESADLRGNEIDLGYGESYIPYLHYLGAYRPEGPDVSKRFQLISSRPGTFALTLSFRELAPDLIVDLTHTVRAFALEQTRVEIERTERQVLIRARVLPPLSNLRIERRSRGRSILDALSWEWSPEE